MRTFVFPSLLFVVVVFLSVFPSLLFVVVCSLCSLFLCRGLLRFALSCGLLCSCSSLFVLFCLSCSASVLCLCLYCPARVALWSLLGCIDTRRGAATHVGADQLRSLAWLPVSALVLVPCVRLCVWTGMAPHMCVKEWPLFRSDSMLPSGYIHTHSPYFEQQMHSYREFLKEDMGLFVLAFRGQLPHCRI